MLASIKILAAGVAAAALFGAAPAAAQYYPYGSSGGTLSISVGTPGYGYGNAYGYGNPYANPYGYADNLGYGVSQQAMIGQCTAAVQARLGAGYGDGYGGGYGSYGAYNSGRVLGISRVEPRGDGGLTVRGVASSNGGSRPDLTFLCRSNGSGYLTSVDVQNAASAYGYAPPYASPPYGAAPYVTEPYGYAVPNATPYATGPYGYTRY